MPRPKPQPPQRSSNLRPRSQRTTGKLKSFRQLPYHIALSQAARLEAWTQDVDALGYPSEAVDSSDFDPRLMERE